jgi:hypothetical protein
MRTALGTVGCVQGVIKSWADGRVGVGGAGGCGFSGLGGVMPLSCGLQWIQHLANLHSRASLHRVRGAICAVR